MRNQILQLLNDNRSAPRRFGIQNDANGDATIYLYDVIAADDWYGGISAASFVQQLMSISAPTIHLRINSPGGDVFEARAMAQAIREHPSDIIAHVDGYAASAATFPAIACSKVLMAEGAMFMIHRGSALAWGTGDDLRATAELLDKVDASLVDSYVAKTGQSNDDIIAWMDAETWFTAEEAVDAGFADELAGGTPENSARWNLSAYKNPPAPAARKTSQPEPPQPSPAPVPPAPENTADFAAMRRRLALNACL
ncbi:head maturation protease, ClpP-related [Burkholderia gladioli]|uniref:head maturation protease, ClpP-related n=1 Tax=Burkholderia gladioli TaxID=28095 RepID=UPI001640BFF2|nr:head maturation protease, ClpP-related [Burkholderia gladioli]